jgi:hypothetical protein
MAKRVDALKAKEKKQKILAAVLGVVLLALLAIQGPKVWKQLHPPPPRASAEETTTTTAAPPVGTPTLAAPTLQGGAQPSPASGSGTLVSSNTPPMQDGVLASFSRFASKDPFAQQLSTGSGAATGGGSSGSSAGSGSGSGSGSSAPDLSSGPGSPPAPGTAVISVNGTLYQVPAGTDFPQASESDPTVVPLFHLVSLGSRSAKISIVGGSYANGAKTVTLKQNKPVTLMNTADGTRYTLVLKPQGTSVPTADDDATSAPTTITLPPATP